MPGDCITTLLDPKIGPAAIERTGYLSEAKLGALFGDYVFLGIDIDLLLAPLADHNLRHDALPSLPTPEAPRQVRLVLVW